MNGFKPMIAEITMYDNSNLAIILLTAEDYDLYADLTVNLGAKLPENCAYVNTNDFPKAEAFILQHGFGMPTGAYMNCGYCRYPLYSFDIAKLKSLGSCEVDEEYGSTFVTIA